MNNSITIIIKGKPKGKQRARKGAYGNWYNPQSAIMKQLEREVENQLPEGFKRIESHVPVMVNTTMFFVPQKLTKSMVETIKNEDVYWTKKPDRDNAEKFILDILSGIVFYDDNQVCDGRVAKFMTPDNPRTEIEVQW